MTAARQHLAGDWFPRGIPASVRVGADTYLDSAYGFDGVCSRLDPAVTLGDACGAYDRAALLVGPHGRLTVGAYTVLNGCTLVCSERVTIGEHCLLAWGAVVTDSWDGPIPLARRRARLAEAVADPDRWLTPADAPRPVTLADNVWVGFDAVIRPGTTIGRGAVVSSRSVVTADVPPYAIVAGNPARVIRELAPDDTDEARAAAFATYLRSPAR